MKYSIIIPCYNEQRTIIEIVNRVVLNGLKEQEIIIIDDNSTDGTRKILESKISKFKNVKVLFNKVNRGKGFCLQKGFKESKGDIIIIQDADLEYDPKEHKALVKPIIENKADVVYGSRFRGNGPVRVNLFWHRLANALVTTLTNILTNLSLTDMETCYKAFKKKSLEGITLKEKRFGIEPEITIKFSKKKLRIFEIGISYNGRNYNEGKKINIIDGFVAIICIFRYSFFD